MHVDTDLSAYLDGELPPAGRARVDAHLDACDRCRARLSELRATAALVAALPSPRPARSLVPRVAARFNWLRPVRSFSAVASGAFLFVFLVTAVARSGAGLGGGTAAPFGRAIPATVPQAAESTAAPVPAAISAPAADAARVPAATVAPPPAPAFAAQQPTPAPKVLTAATPSPLPRAEGLSGPREVARTASPSPLALIDPLLWLGLAMIAAVVAAVAHLRLRTTDRAIDAPHKD